MLFLLLILTSSSLYCEEKCCRDQCEYLCDSYLESFTCNLEGIPSRADSYQCMQGFLVAETEIRLLMYNIKFYGIHEILQQLIVVLKQLPILHADCYLFIQQLIY